MKGLSLVLICVSVCACFMGAGIALAVPASSTNYGLDCSVVDGGGGQASAASQSLSGVADHPSPIGDSSSDSYDIQPGFLAGLLIPLKNMTLLSTTPTGPTVDLIDSTTGTGVGSPISFYNNTVTPIAGFPIDVDGDGVKEYAVVAQRTDNLIICQARQTDGTLIQAFFVTNATQADVLNVYAAQMDAVAGEELVVGNKARLSDGRPVVAVHDPSTGAKNMETYLFNPNWTVEWYLARDN